ncbi:MAG TPA: CsgG/HfaB family protein, partial [Thermodesulfobacteriota bacterium]
MRSPKVAALALAVALAGCTSFDTREVVRTAPDDPRPGVTAQTGRILKRKVAVARFTNETNYGAGLFRDAAGDRLGKQASDILVSDLTRSGKFI